MCNVDLNTDIESPCDLIPIGFVFKSEFSQTILKYLEFEREVPTMWKIIDNNRLNDFSHLTKMSFDISLIYKFLKGWTWLIINLVVTFKKRLINYSQIEHFKFTFCIKK